MAASVGSDFKIEGTRPPSHDSKAQTVPQKTRKLYFKAPTTAKKL